MKGVNQGTASGPYDIALIQAQVWSSYILSGSICKEVTLTSFCLDKIIHFILILHARAWY
jgi:hypothetical protein